ncbi:MAG: hypothetical protein OEV12_02295 [Gammaproteobacteria bacterium]|nr:hypothetical protein [Gammaproteobacteria bacterium]MDH3888221.1 hypothetical protein [Gammaproteobacteria bacterium]MDH3933752.1 hypothetical protein [Gammaproteobacteria bacterium]MDH3985227.1 hypothetical protein [Gammaproteobacteria bacterium]
MHAAVCHEPQTNRTRRNIHAIFYRQDNDLAVLIETLHDYREISGKRDGFSGQAPGHRGITTH